jgi:hypothetical protein
MRKGCEKSGAAKLRQLGESAITDSFCFGLSLKVSQAFAGLEHSSTYLH